MKRTLTLALCLFQFAFLSAQDEELFSLRFNCFSWVNSIQNAYFDTVSGAEKITVPNGNLSSKYNYQGYTRNIVFYRPGPPDAMGIPTKKEIGRFSFADGWDNAFLLFIPDFKDKEEYYKVLPISGNLNTIRPDHYRFINMTDKTVATKFGQKEIVLKPKGFETIEGIPNIDEGENMSIVMVKREENEWNKAYSSRWTYKEGARYLVLIVEPTRKGRRLQVARLRL